jgi:hypothetical protein
MANKKFVWGMTGIVLVFAVVLGGCEATTGGDDGNQNLNSKSITLLNMDGVVIAPVGRATPRMNITTTEYSGTISWKDSEGTDIGFSDKFEPNTVYVAAVILTPKSGYTFTGVGTFTHSGADEIRQEPDGGRLKVTITFPDTGELTQVSLLDLDEYLTVPAVGETPVTTVTNDEYTGTILWYVFGVWRDITVFQSGTSYDARFSLTAKAGYTFAGLAGSDFFAYSGAVSVTCNPSQNGDTASLTVTFPSTESPEAITNTADIAAYLQQPQLHSPVVLKLQLELSTNNWQAILVALSEATTLSEATIFVLLDLADCTASSSATNGGLSTNGTFDPHGADTHTNRVIGKKTIQYLILPTAATSIPEATGGNPAFKNFDRLRSVSSNTLEAIGGYAFYGCEYLTSVSIPASASIGNEVFSGSQNVIFTLTGSGDLSTGEGGKMLIRNNNELLAYSLHPNTVTLPASITIIGGRIFSSRNLRSISADGVLSIGEYTFIGFNRLETVSLPAATSIGDQAFSHCTSLETVTLPAADTIVNSAFSGCTSLETVTLPLAETIGYTAFSDCTSLETVTLPLADTIGSGTFSGCTSLETVSLPAATSIGNGAFSYCTSLETVTLPAATSIGSQAFYGCTSLATVTLGAVTPPLVGNYLFDTINATQNVTVRVPQASFDAYKGDYVDNNSAALNWGNAFRGKGWDGENYSYLGYSGIVNTNIHLTFVGYTN